MTLLVATGLKREAALIARPGLRTVVSGGRADLLDRRLRAAAEGATAVLSLGIGGALAPGLQPGDWVVASRVVAHEQAWETDPKWAAALRRAAPAPSSGPILGSDVMLRTAAAKAEAHARTGALAVDMESHVAAAVARELGLPFAAVRVISDSCDHDLPPAVEAGMRPDGGMALAPVLASLLRSPSQLPALIRAGRDAGTAFRALGRMRLPG